MGILIYLSHTRLDISYDISYVVGIVSQYMHDSWDCHMEVVYRIVRYLKSALGKGILFSHQGHMRVEAFILGWLY